MNEIKTANYLMWIRGTTKIEDFIEESLQLGISKKLPFLPRLLNKGSKIYLASLQIKLVRDIRGKIKHETNPIIFGEFVVNHVDFIVNTIEPLLNKKFEKRGLVFQQLTKKQTRKEPRRKEGKRLTIGSIYAVNYPPDDYTKKIENRKGIFTIYNPFLSIKGIKFFRGLKYFDLDDYLIWYKKQNEKDSKQNN